MAYTIERAVEKLLRDRNINLTGEKVFRLFKQMEAAVMRAGEDLYAYTSEPTYTQRRILKTFQIQPTDNYGGKIEKLTWSDKFKN